MTVTAAGGCAAARGLRRAPQGPSRLNGKRHGSVALSRLQSVQLCLLDHARLNELRVERLELALVDGAIAHIRDFRYVPYIADDAAIVLSA